VKNFSVALRPGRKAQYKYHPALVELFRGIVSQGS